MLCAKAPLAAAACSARPQRSLRLAAVPTFHAGPARWTPSSHVFSRRGSVVRGARPTVRVASEPFRVTETSSLPAVDGSFSSTHTFASYANWLVPGSLMLGRYPFIEPSRCKTRIQGEDQLRTILEAGLTVFCSLQEELPEQVNVPIGGLNGFLPYKATVDLMASAMSGPVPQEQQVGLRNPWLDQYLPPRKREAEKQENKIEPEYQRFPITDRDIPSLADVDAIVDNLTARIRDGKKVYLHCWGGRGRAGVVGACYLIKTYRISADEALQRVQMAYDTRRDNERQSPETDAQIQFVRDYAAHLSS